MDRPVRPGARAFHSLFPPAVRGGSRQGLFRMGKAERRGRRAGSPGKGPRLRQRSGATAPRRPDQKKRCQKKGRGKGAGAAGTGRRNPQRSRYGARRGPYRTTGKYATRRPYGKRGPYDGYGPRKKYGKRGPYDGYGPRKKYGRRGAYEPRRPRFGRGQTCLLRRDWLRWKHSCAIRKARRAWHVTRSHGMNRDHYLVARPSAQIYGGQFLEWDCVHPAVLDWDGKRVGVYAAVGKPEASRHKHNRWAKVWRLPKGRVTQPGSPHFGEMRWKLAFRRFVKRITDQARRRMDEPGFRIDPDGAWRSRRE